MQDLTPAAVTASDEDCSRRAAIVGLGTLSSLWLAGCTPTGPPAGLPGYEAPAPAPVPFEQAVINAANAVFSSVSTRTPGRVVAIDPLVNGVTGEQSAATRTIQRLVTALAKDKYPQLNVQPLTASTISQKPLI